MKYSKLLSKKKEYTYSANICFDLRSEEKIDSFIPNKTTTEILREYLGGIISGTSEIHSRILYGSYGTGKSHLLTVMSAVLGQINTNGEGYKNLIKRISKYDIELTQDIKHFVKQSKPFLIVPIYSDYPEFNKCISYSLKKELDQRGIYVPFKGFFDEALMLVRKWDSIDEPHKKLIAECKAIGITKNQLIEGLRIYNPESEEWFKKVYEGMSFGAEFNSAAGNLIDNLNAANEAINKDYSGIIFVFDEFGRYVEDYGDTIKVKQVQELAEYCDHNNNSNYLILVSHKQLSLYTEGMKRAVADEWKKVEGRFKATSINIKYDQCLSLIEYIIPKTTAWKKFKEKYNAELLELYNQAWDFKGFLLPPETENKSPFEGGFPLHPITLYALDRLSKKVAQNERTFFTYLAGDEENSLFSQLEKMDDSKFHFVGLDDIFDYFEVNIKAHKTDSSYAVYKKLQYAISKLGTGRNITESKILKAMAVIYIIADADVIVADKKTLVDVIDGTDSEISKAINKLEEKRIIRFMRQYGQYDFFDSSIFDLEGMIEEKVSGINDDMVINTLNERFSNFAIYPYDYNDSYHMNRVFMPIFIQGKDINKKIIKANAPKYYDGLVLYVLDDNKDSIDYNSIEQPDRSIIIVNYDGSVLRKEVANYIAIQYFWTKREELAKEDPSVVNELGLYLAEQRAIVDDLIRKWREFELSNIETYVNKVAITISSEEELSEVASNVMKDSFNRTIIINNDLLNKNELTGAIKLARKKALNSIINNDDIYADCPVLSPEFNIVRAALSRTGISIDGSVEKSLITRIDKKASGEYVNKTIEKFLKKATKGKVGLSDLYMDLKNPPFGLRDGYIPVLVAYALRQYQNVSLYFHEKEVAYTEEELVKAFESVDDYSVYICNWNEDQNSYISSLEGIFNRYLKKNDSKNRLKNLFEAMNTHFSSISRLARTTDLYVSDSAKCYREILSLSHSDYNKFFFEELPKINNDYSDLAIKIRDILDEFEKVNTKILKIIRETMIEILGIDGKTLTKSIKKKYIESWKEKKNRAFDYKTNEFLEYISSIDKQSEEEIVKRLAKLFSDFDIEYWSDAKIDDFRSSLKDTIAKIDNFVPCEAEEDTKITIQTGTGEQVVSQFSQIELSTKGKMLLNKLQNAVDNFGGSIGYEEKINILTQLLKDVIR